MIFELLTPDATWSTLPRRFPTPDGLTADEWFDGIADRYAQLRGGTLTDEQAGALRVTLDDVRGRILPDDVATLLYRPADVPVTAVVHVQVAPPDAVDADALRWAMIPVIDLALPPLVDDFVSPELGAGRKGAFISADRFADDVTAGGLSYAFATPYGVVTVFTGPSTPTVIGMLEAELDEIVRTIRIRDEPEGAQA